MKKRILGAMLTVAMVFSSLASVIADVGYNYDGIKPLKKLETLIDQLNFDAVGTEFSKDTLYHTVQLAVLREANQNFATNAGVAGSWDDYIDLVYETHNQPYITNYMKTLSLSSNSLNDITSDFNVVEGNGSYNTRDLNLKDSFAKLAGYKEAMKPVFANNRDELNSYTLTQGEIDAYVLDPTLHVFRYLLSSKGAGGNSSEYMEFNYKQWLHDDRAKKIFAILYGEDLTKELAYDGKDDANEGVTRTLKNYMQTPEGMLYVKQQLENIFVEGVGESTTGMYNFIGNVLYKAYNNKDVQSDVQMLFGGNGNKGAFELGMNAVDIDDKVANVWINLVLSEYVQTSLLAGTLNTVCNGSTATPVEIIDNSSVSFKIENLFEEYEIGSNAATSLSLRNSWFNLVCYNTDGTENSYVTYDGEKIQITEDSTKGVEYDAYFVLYRSSDGNDENTFIESYPVKIHNKTISTGNSGGSSKVYINYNTNGGDKINSTSHTKGTVVQLDKVPVREGYIFTGWYSDEALTQKIDSLTITASTTVYAGWKKDGSAVVSVVDIPELLEGEHHYAYIMGYPEGDVRPYGNITRAETVTMVFRLLKDSVRASNLTETNSFTDVDGDDWFNTAVSTLAGMGIVEGRTETEFKPNANITRAEFATIFARLAEFDAVAEQTYGDVDRHWAEEHIYEASAYGWIAGYEDDTFRPNKAINRAEAMTLVNRVLKRVPESKEDLLDGMTVWSDNADTTVWYYLAVQEATNSHDHVMKNEAYEKWTVLTENKDWTVFEK